MTKLDHNDDTLFDRLVDGELSPAERQRLLASLDDPLNDGREQRWRHCALAFLESQAWGHEFKQMLAEPSDDKQAIVAKQRTFSSNIQPGHWLAIAAGLLLAFSLGWLIKSPLVTSQQSVDVASAHGIDPLERQEMPLRDELTEATDEDAVTLLVRDTNGNHQRFQVPLMEVEDIDDQFGASLPAELRARFRDRGFDVQRRRRFAPMFFEQDEQLVPMVVPVEDTYVVPVSRPIY